MLDLAIGHATNKRPSALLIPDSTNEYIPLQKRYPDDPVTWQLPVRVFLFKHVSKVS